MNIEILEIKKSTVRLKIINTNIHDADEVYVFSYHEWDVKNEWSFSIEGSYGKVDFLSSGMLEVLKTIVDYLNDAFILNNGQLRYKLDDPRVGDQFIIDQS